MIGTVPCLLAASHIQLFAGAGNIDGWLHILPMSVSFQKIVKRFSDESDTLTHVNSVLSSAQLCSSTFSLLFPRHLGAHSEFNGSCQVIRFGAFLLHIFRVLNGVVELCFDIK